MIQGRSVYRDNLLSLAGQPYAAWIKLDFDSPKDRYQNFMTSQFHVPTYTMKAEDSLNGYQIKELGDDKKQAVLVKAIENGGGPLVTVTKDGQDTKLYLEAAPRYHQINFFREDGKSEKREQFLKPEFQQQQKQAVQKGQAKGQEQGIAV